MRNTNKDLRLNKEQEVLFNSNIKYSYKLAAIFSEKYNLDREECVSICLEQLARAIKEYRPKDKNSKLTGWISFVTENRIKTAATAEAKREEKQSLAIIDINSSNDYSEATLNSFDYNEILSVLDTALKNYPEDHQQMFKEITFNNRTLMEVGTMFGISHTSVAKIIKDIRISFRESYYI